MGFQGPHAASIADEARPNDGEDPEARRASPPAGVLPNDVLPVYARQESRRPGVGKGKERTPTNATEYIHSGAVWNPILQISANNASKYVAMCTRKYTSPTARRVCGTGPAAGPGTLYPAGDQRSQAPHEQKKTAHPAVDASDPGELPTADSGPAAPIAHEVTRLVLLPSGPDTVHGAPLPGTGPSTPAASASTETGSRLGRGYRPC